MLTAMLLLVAAAIMLRTSLAIDAQRAADISRDIRQHFRSSGMNWVSPKMLHDVIDLETNTKPIMYLFSKQTSPACQQLMQQLIDMDDSMLSQLSSQFLAVLVLDDYNSQFGEDYAPGGATQVPRVLFADPGGKLRLEMKNPQSDDNAAYYYANALEVVDMMRDILRYHQDQELSLARQALRVPGSSQAAPVSSLRGGTGQFRADLEHDLPS